MEHACDNIEDFITKRSSAGAVGAGTKSTEKKEVEKKEKYVTIKKKKELPAPEKNQAWKKPSLEKIQCLEKVKCDPNL